MKLEVSQSEFIKYHRTYYHETHRIRWPRYILLAGTLVMYALWWLTLPPTAFIGVPIFIASMLPILIVLLRGIKMAREYADSKLVDGLTLDVTENGYKMIMASRFKDEFDVKWPNLVMAAGFIALLLFWIYVAKPISYAGIAIFVVGMIPSIIIGRRVNKGANSHANKHWRIAMEQEAAK